jgi:hypothetical protein
MTKFEFLNGYPVKGWPKEGWCSNQNNSMAAQKQGHETFLKIPEIIQQRHGNQNSSIKRGTS